VKPRRIEVVLFDLDDTLHDDTSAYLRAAARVASEVAKERGVSEAELVSAYVEEVGRFWGMLSVDDLAANVGRVRTELWSRALARLGIDDEEFARQCAQRYNEYRRAHFVLYPGALELLQALRRDGKRVALVTNGFAETHHDKITILKLRDVLDAIFIADEVGMVKPDPKLFVRACETLGSPPERGAMVGDRYERDIRGAAEAGLFTVWVNVRSEDLPEGAPPPDAVCTTIREVGPILESASPVQARGS
jgi:putative hydrolase of the HAD superfamily